MPASPCRKGSWVMLAGHRDDTISSGLELAGSLLSSVPSNDSSDVQTETTPPTSPTSSEGKTRAPRDVLGASRRLARISAWALQGDLDPTPTQASKQFHRRAPSGSVTNDEAGYDADGDGDGDSGDRNKDRGNRAGAGTTAITRPTCRPAFLRIDTRQRRRAASMFVTRHPTTSEPAFGDGGIPRSRRSRLPSISVKHAVVRTANAESYELRPRPGAEPVGLGIGFPENHPLRSRVFSMPVLTSPPVSDLADEPKGEVVVQDQGRKQARRSEWFSFSLPTGPKKTTTKVGVHAPSPVRLVLRPTFLESSPSPIESLPAQVGAGMFRCEAAHDWSKMEHERHRALAQEGRPRLNLS